MLDERQFGERYHLEFAAAFCRGRLGIEPGVPASEAISRGLAAELNLHKFKRTRPLPRVVRVLGALRGLQPTDLLDVGTGRGVFLWPLLDAFPGLPVSVLDVSEQRAADLDAVRRGGVATLSVHHGDICSTDLDTGSSDVVTALEVLEHIVPVELAVRELVRLARRAVIVSVPSKEDQNPEHVHLLDRVSLERLFRAAGARNVNLSYVLNHIVAVVGAGF